MLLARLQTIFIAERILIHSCRYPANWLLRRQCRGVNKLESQETNEMYLFVQRYWTLSTKILTLAQRYWTLIQFFKQPPNAWRSCCLQQSIFHSIDTECVQCTYTSYVASWTMAYVNFDILPSSPCIVGRVWQSCMVCLCPGKSPMGD